MRAPDQIPAVSVEIELLDVPEAGDAMRRIYAAASSADPERHFRGFVVLAVSLPALAQHLATSTSSAEAWDDQRIEDDQLRLLFTCCHPALAPEAQVAMTLREGVLDLGLLAPSVGR